MPFLLMVAYNEDASGMGEVLAGLNQSTERMMN